MLVIRSPESSFSLRGSPALACVSLSLILPQALASVMRPDSFPLLRKARVYPNQLSFKLTQKIRVSLGREPLQKAWPEDYCSPASGTGEKECQHS